MGVPYSKDGVSRLSVNCEKRYNTVNPTTNPLLASTKAPQAVDDALIFAQPDKDSVSLPIETDQHDSLCSCPGCFTVRDW